jgi:hypothetical protein
LSFALALVVAVAGRGSIHLDRDPDIAPAANVDRIWVPPQSVRVSNLATPQLEELRSVGESNGLQEHNAQAYDLPALADLALRINPQTRSAWYAAQAARAQFRRQAVAPAVEQQQVFAVILRLIRARYSDSYS